MNGKWWRYAIIAVLLLDMCLLVVGAIPVMHTGVLGAPWIDGLALQGISFDGCMKARVLENVTLAAAVLLTVTVL